MTWSRMTKGKAKLKFVIIPHEMTCSRTTTNKNKIKKLAKFSCKMTWSLMTKHKKN